MSAVSFRKKINQLASCFCVLTLGASLVCALHCKNALLIEPGKSFYFLVSGELHTQAGVYETAIQGGAGYLLDDGERNYAVYQVYFSKAEADRVQEKNSEKSSVLCISIPTLCFYTRKQKKQAVTLREALLCLDGCMQVINHEIKRLEDGATQESCKRILRIVERHLEYIQKMHDEDFRGFSESVFNVRTQLNESMEEIVFAQKLRYILCELSVAYIRLCEEYSYGK